MGGTRAIYEARLEYAMAQWPPIVKESEKRWNAKYLLPFAHPPYEFMGNKRFERIEDLKGLRVRASPLVAKAFAKFGAVPVAIPTAELYTAVERGMVDLAGFPWSYCFGAFKIHEVSKYATIGIDMGSYNCAVYVSKSDWDSLPEDIKAIHNELMKDYNQVLADGYEKADKKWIPIYKKAGIEITTLAASEKAKLMKGVSDLYEEWVKKTEAKGLPGRDAFNHLKALREKVLAGEIPYL
jgi:TRAP-type C4-dicarboxylate transport system substrate-binding protein